MCVLACKKRRTHADMGPSVREKGLGLAVPAGRQGRQQTNGQTTISLLLRRNVYTQHIFPEAGEAPSLIEEGGRVGICECPS